MAETLFDAISAGIDNMGATPPAAEPEVENGSGDELDTSTSSDEGDAAGTELETGAADGAAAGDDAESGTEEGDDAASEDPAGDEAAGDEDPAADADGEGKKPDAKTQQPVKEKDPVNDPIPNALKKETKERMQSLITAVKDRDTKLEQVTQQRNEWVQMVTETGASAEQYGDALKYLSMVNSGDPEKQKAALQFMQQEVATLAKIVGVPVAGVDMLAEHPDLQQKVRDNLMLQEDAEEIAAARSAQAHQTNVRSQQQQHQQTQQQQAQELQAGREALTALGNDLAKKDPMYARKKALLVPALRQIMAQTPPKLWKQTFQSAYDNLKLPTPAQTARTGVPANQPLRGKTPSGGAQKEPGSLLEAISSGIAQAGK